MPGRGHHARHPIGVLQEDIPPPAPVPHHLKMQVGKPIHVESVSSSIVTSTGSYHAPEVSHRVDQPTVEQAVARGTARVQLAGMALKEEVTTIGHRVTAAAAGAGAGLVVGMALDLKGARTMGAMAVGGYVGWQSQ